MNKEHCTDQDENKKGAKSFETGYIALEKKKLSALETKKS